jgi:excisionase family DNA binding protein
MASKPTQTIDRTPVRRWASMRAAADYAGVSLRTIREWIAQGKIVGYQINKRVIRVDLNELDEAFKPFGGGAA